MNLGSDFSDAPEQTRIQEVFDTRDKTGKRELYAWHRPEVRQQHAALERCLALLLNRTFGKDLSCLRVLDVGCGDGCLLRTFAEWGVSVDHLMGTEFLKDRIQYARRLSASAIRWHVGGLDFGDEASFDLVTAHTVFSSVLTSDNRCQLAADMWKMTKPGGWLQVFDFRFNNPSNNQVKKVTPTELAEYWPDGVNSVCKTLILAPPISRRLTHFSYILSEIVHSLVPFLRSHFIYMTQKPRI